LRDEIKRWLGERFLVEKILCVTNDFGPRAGGIETFIIGLIERLPKGSIIVYTSAQDKSEPYDQQWLDSYGVEVIRDKARILLPTPGVAYCVSALIKDRGIKTAFFGAAAPLGLLAPVLRRAGVTKIIALTHGHEVWWSKVWPFTWAMKSIARNVDHLTYLGEFTRRAISRTINSSAQSAMVKIAPGIDTDHFAPSDSSKLTSELGLTDKKVIVSVGRLVHRKGQDVLIEAMPHLLEEIPDAHLVLIGEGPYRGYLETRVKNLGIDSKVTFIGRITYVELPRYICLGEVFVMPSRSRLAGLEVEGLGIVYLEASACGLPVIAGNSGGAPDAVVQGVTGLVVNGKDQHAVAMSIATLLNDQEKAREMGRRGREWVIDQWRWEIWSEKFRELLKLAP
jgi:phosphatidylinositol alpha-1,6-mannosyltransferase